MNYKNYFELASIQGELQGIASGLEIHDFNRQEAMKALRELAKKIENIQKTEKIDKG